jgi:hypothetical protein
MKYCPLCRSEYRDSVSVCAECELGLVPSLDNVTVRGNPPKLLWIGKNTAEFDRVAAALRDAGIPLHAVSGGMLGRLLRSDSTIHVRSSDFLQSVGLAEQAFENVRKNLGETQTCYACAAACSAALTACPKCRATLHVERETNRPESEKMADLQGHAPDGELKYCPMCDSEYSAAHERCGVCGVELVPEKQRGQPLSEKEKKDLLELIWRGGDPVALGRVVAALKEGGIRHHVQSTSDHLVFELAMPRPKYIVRVFRSDAANARELMGGIQDGPFFGADALLESRDVEPRNRTRDFVAKWNPAAATNEIWSSDESALTRLVEDCLNENGIRFRRQGIEPATAHLFVRPESETGAREIIRQIVEGMPQE